MSGFMKTVLTTESCVFFFSCLAAYFFDFLIYFSCRYDSSLQNLLSAPLAACLLVLFFYLFIITTPLLPFQFVRSLAQASLA